MRRYSDNCRLYDEREDIDVSPERIIEVEIGVEVGSDMKIIILLKSHWQLFITVVVDTVSIIKNIISYHHN